MTSMKTILLVAAITALAMSPDAKRVAWGDEEGNAGVAEI